MNSEEMVKRCCALIYESDFAKILLGDSFHPGGLKLTERLGTLLKLTPQSRVLDIASGKGTSAVFIAERFGSRVVGIDYGRQNVEEANALADSKGLSAQVSFQQGDAERLPLAGGAFDAVLCECAFCTFANKPAAAREFSRVLVPGGRVGLSDLTRGSALPKELDGLLAWVACIGDAQPLLQYQEYLTGAGFQIEQAAECDEALLELVNQIRMKLLGVEVMAGLKKIDIPNVDLSAAKQMAQAAQLAVKQGALGYAIISAAL